MRIDFFPTGEINGVKFCKGHALPLGATYFGNEIVNFSINSSTATSCTLVLYHKGEAEPYVEITIPSEFKIGDNYSIMVFGLNIENTEYGYKFDGEYNPAKGLLFDKNRVLLDPYAKLISGNEIWGKPAYRNTSFPMRGCILQTDYDWEGDVPINRPMEETIIYEMHVRGFTKHDSSQVKYPGTYAGIIRKIPYLKELGVNCVELLPVFEFNEKEFSNIPNDKRDFNYWGYSPINFFAPKAGYAQLAPMGMAADEFKNMVKKLHQNGIEVILDVVFNHSGEMTENDFYCFKGIDNPAYYILNKDGTNSNYSGCGNTMNCNHTVTREMILDSLRNWVFEYHIDGFRFDLASILTRDIDGTPMQNPPVLETLAETPLLAHTKLIAEAWDAGGLYQVGNFPAPKRWAEWNGKFRDIIRSFMRSDAHAGIDLIKRMQGSPDIYSNKNAGAVVNFVTCHDGFTLKDLVSYNEKHNEANGENNRDGSNDNCSWNCGVEGETENKEINELRKRNSKTAMALLLLSRGTPMILAGDEFGNTQFGNNNAYCQDNEISWLDWKQTETNKDMLEFVKKLIKFRKEHPVLRRSDFYTGYNSSGYPEISFHGTIPWQIDETKPMLTFAMMLVETAKDFGVEKDSFIYVGINEYWDVQPMELPVIPAGFVWHKYLDSSDKNHNDYPEIHDKYFLAPRTVTVLIAQKN